jgi:MoaA/NifB/PqqE/SkfB family radical SAM enzyme
VLTGGDPLKRGDLFALIARARELGFEVSVSPSATPLLSPEAIGQLKRAGVDAISLSLDGSTAALHDALRRVPGCFARTLEAASAAQAVGLPFQVNTLVSRETRDDLPAILPVVRSLGAARWSLFFLVTVGRGAMLNPLSAQECEALFGWVAALPRGGLVVTTTEAPHYRRVLLQRLRARGEGTPRPVLPGLGIRDGNGVMFISNTGEVTPSGFLPVVVGKVRSSDPVTLYRSAETFVKLRRTEDFEGRCGRCAFREPCGGSRARALAGTGNLLGEDPLCLYEPGAEDTTAVP